MSNSMHKNHDAAEVNYAPWERTFKKVLSPFELFIHQQTTSGLLLMVSAVVALFLANSQFAGAYAHLLHLPVALSVGDWGIQMSLHHWVNDALMALFFFVVGLELKREFMVGELSDMRQAALPIIAAVGGMVLPALIFLAFNVGTDRAAGWGIPMATDIAFAVGVLVLLAQRVPKALVTFLVALAIADDLGAVLVIAVFYTQQLHLVWLLVASALVLVLVTLNFAGIRHVAPYFITAILLWFAMYASGVHATLAGVLGAFTVPARSKYNPATFTSMIMRQVTDFATSQKADGNVMTNEKLYAISEHIEESARGVQTPLQRLEHAWHLPVAFLVIPVFALFNAGVPLEWERIGETATHPVFLGVLCGLLLGKFLGITGACWLALKSGVGQLPSGTTFSQVAGVSILGGIGFTMSIFIAELGFNAQPDYLLMAKTGVLAASLIAGLTGFLLLRFLRPAQA